MKTVKIKLPFQPRISRGDRLRKLYQWAKILVRSSKPKVIEEKHYESLSYIVVESSRDEKHC